MARPVYLVAEECERGGVARNIIETANGLRAVGREVHLIAPAGPMRPLLNPAIPVVEIPKAPQALVPKLTWAVEVHQTIVRVVKQEGAILHSHKRFSDGVVRLCALRRKAVHVSTCHNWFTDHRGLSVYGDWTVAVADRVSRHLVSRYRKPSNRVRTIYNGVTSCEEPTDEARRDARMKWGVEEDALVLMSVAHFSYAKDRMLLLKAVLSCEEEMLERRALLMLVGDGAMKPEAESFVQQYRLAPLVRFVPGDADIESLWNVADIGVLSSRQEGLPYVILDAAVRCIPHIATDVGGVIDFIKDGETGTLIQHGDVHGLGRAILRMLEDEVYREKCGMNAHALVVRQHDPARFIANLCAVYDEASAS